VGIELGSYSIKMAETIKTGDGLQLLSHGMVEIPADKRGRSQRDVSVISDLVKQLLSLCKHPSPRVYFSISGPMVCFHRLSLPPMPEKEVMPAITWKGKKEFPFSLSESRVLYKKIPGASPGDKEMDILVAAALNRFISSELLVFQKIGISPEGIDSVASAVRYSLEHGSVDNRSKTIAVLDIGAENTMLSIIKGNELHFSREISTGGNDFAQAFTEPFTLGGKQFALGFEEAQKLMTTYGIPLGKDKGTTPQGIPLSRIMFMIRPVMEKLITETLRSFDFYKAQTKEKAVDQVLLCGGAAGLENLTEVLSSGLGIKVDVYDPFENIMVPPEIGNDETFNQNRHQLAVALGLSLGQCRDFNFLLLKGGGLGSKKLREWIPAFAFILFMFGLFTLYTGLDRSVEASRKGLESKKAELASLNVSIDELSRLKDKRDKLREKLADFPPFVIEQPSFVDIFVSLSGVFPESVALERIALERGRNVVKDGRVTVPEMRLSLEGFAAGKDYKVLGLLTQITEELGTKPFFQNAMIDASEKRTQFGRPGIRFVLKCALNPALFI